MGMGMSCRSSTFILNCWRGEETWRHLPEALPSSSSICPLSARIQRACAPQSLVPVSGMVKKNGGSLEVEWQRSVVSHVPSLGGQGCEEASHLVFLDEVSSMFTPRRNWITPPQTFQLRAIKSLSSANCRLVEPHITNLVIMPAAACLAVPCALQKRCAWLGWMGSVCFFGDQTWVLGRCVERRAVRESRGWRCSWEGTRCAGNRLSATV